MMQETGVSKTGIWRRGGMVLMGLLMMATPLCPRVSADVIEREFEFARGLIDLNMPDMAERVMERLVLRNPGLEQRANVVRAEAMIHRRRLSAAEDILRDMPADSPSAQAIRLALADAYFQIGERAKTRQIYTEFFDQYDGEPPTDPDVVRFLRESAYKYAQMLIYDQDFLAAVAVYDLILSVTDDVDQKRQILLEQAEMALKAAEDTTLSDGARDNLYKKAEGNFTEVLWGGMDLWFGRALTAYAQYMVLRGNRDEARRMLQSNIRLMRDMDKQLQEQGIPMSESPMAGARSLLGRLFMDEGHAMVADAETRHAEVLERFERAIQDFQAEWRIMERAKRREDAARERAAEGQPLEASMATPERMRPYNDMVQSLEGFLSVATQTGWDSAVAQRAQELENGVRQLYNSVREFEFEPGISPNLGISIGESFRGNVVLRQGGQYLRPEEERRNDAVQHYVRALTEYYNVFADYAGSHWSATAGEIVARLRTILYDLTGRTVVIDTAPGQEERIALVYLKEGHSLFSREQYDEAIEQYLMGLNIAGESTDAMIALSNLMEAHAKRGEPYMVRAFADYVAERFAGRPEGAQALLRIARHYFDANEAEMYLHLYELFLDQFADHDRAPAVLFMLGEQRWRVKDYAGSAIFYRRVIERYPQSPEYLRAISRISWGYFLAQDYTNAISAFNKYLDEAPASQEKAQAQLCLAESYRMAGQPVDAMRAYDQLIRWLTPETNPYTGSAEDRRKNQEILEQSEFFIGFSLSQFNEPPERIPAYRERAIQQFQGFLEKYPQSRLAPTAMASLGAIFFERDRAEDAARTFEQLAERYPDSEAGQNARFAMIRSLIDIGQLDKAKEVFEEMLRDADRYSPGQFVRVGQLMLDRNEYAAAEQALERVKGSTDERAMLERALFGLGRAQIELEKYDQAIGNLRDLINRYPTSGRFFDARFLLGRALSAQGKFGDAVEAMHDVFRRASDPELINRASVELAGLQLQRGDMDGALASFQRVVLLGDPDIPEIRPHIEQALLGSIRIFRDREAWDEVIENCDLYMRYFTLRPDADQVRRWRSEALMRRAAG